MSNRKNLIVIAVLVLNYYFVFGQEDEIVDILQKGTVEKRIPVLNFGTFHFGKTTDARKTEFNEHDIDNKKRAHQVAKMLSSFKPTVIVVESVPENQKLLEELYEGYLENPNIKFKNPNEIHLLAFEVGRLSGAKRIYGIDHKMNYDYNIHTKIKNDVDSLMVSNYFDFFSKVSDLYEKLTFFDKLKIINHNKYLDNMITINADILSYAATKYNHEGSDEAAKYYQRNLRVFSNFNRLKLTSNDRVFILMGASHTAFFRDFIKRSPNYFMVDTFKYLK